MLLLMAERVLAMAPAPLHRFALRIAHRVRRQWWRLRKPTIHGCRVLGLDAAGRVLLVRHSYGSGNWMPPGGGLKPGEDPLLAAAREFREEIGIELAGAWLVTSTHDALHGAGNISYIVAGSCSATPRPDLREIIEAGFFTTGNWPEPMGEVLKRQMEEWLKVER